MNKSKCKRVFLILLSLFLCCGTAFAVGEGDDKGKEEASDVGEVSKGASICELQKRINKLKQVRVRFDSIDECRGLNYFLNAEDLDEAERAERRRDFSGLIVLIDSLHAMLLRLEKSFSSISAVLKITEALSELDDLISAISELQAKILVSRDEMISRLYTIRGAANLFINTITLAERTVGIPTVAAQSRLIPAELIISFYLWVWYTRHRS